MVSNIWRYLENWNKLRTNIGLLVAQLVKSSPAVRETWIQSLVWEDPLEKVKATHSSILAWRIPWIQSMGLQRVRQNCVTCTFCVPEDWWDSRLCETRDGACLFHQGSISLAPSPVFLTELTLINICCINELVQVTQSVRRFHNGWF